MPNPVFLTPWSTSSLQYETLGMGPGPGIELRFSVMHKAYEAMLNSFTELSVNGDLLLLFINFNPRQQLG